MSKTNALETALLQLLYQNANIANIGDATGLRGSSTAGSLWVALWIGDPTDAASGGAEASYTSYARVAVARTSGAWTVTGNTATNAADIDFPASTGGTGGTVTHAAIMTAASGGTMLAKGALSPNIALASGVQPRIPAGGYTHEED